MAKAMLHNLEPASKYKNIEAELWYKWRVRHEVKLPDELVDPNKIQNHALIFLGLESVYAYL